MLPSTSRLSIALLLVVVFSAAVSVQRTSGQVDTGILTGTVRDTSGAVVPKARVTTRNTGTGEVQTLATDSQGLYVSPPARPGEYAIEVEVAGFEKVIKRAELSVAQRLTVDFTLNIGPVTQVVNVQGMASALQTETSTLSNLRNEESVRDLPLNGRNFAQLIGLTAGAMPAQTQVGGAPIVIKRGITAYAVHGLRLYENNFLVEGISDIENHNGLGIMFFPPLEALAEFRVETSVADAQFGRGGGGTVNVVYKSGTRHFHGNLFEFLRNSALDAKNFFDDPKLPIPPFKQNQFGGTLGGPLKLGENPKTFFFVDYEGKRVRQAQTFISTVPTAAFRQGDFSSAAQQIFDPLTQRPAPGGGFERDPFPGNVIPDFRIDRVGRNILNLYPPPNLGTGLANNFLFNPVRKVTSDSFDVKVDGTFSKADAGFIRVSHNRFDVFEPSSLPAPGVGGGQPSGPGTQPATQVVLSETHTLSPQAVNTARFGFTRLNLRQFNIDFGRNVSSDIGVPGANVAGDKLTSGLTLISITGLRELGDNGFTPAILVSNNFQWNDDFSYVRGRHTLKIGGTFERRQYNVFQSNVLRGSLVFTTAFTQNPALPKNTGLGAADTLLGRPISGVIRFLNGTRGFRRSDVAVYVQDDFKVTDKLTLNLGLRYENFIGWPWKEVNRRMYQFVPSTQQVVRVGTEGVPGGSGVEGDNNNFGPRVGLAYKFLPNTVFRAAYGVFYSAPQVEISSNLASNPPEFIASAFSNNQFDFNGARPASLGFDRPAAGTIAGASLSFLDPEIRAPYTQQWNAAIQQQLPSSVLLTIAYAGSKGTKLNADPNINQPVPGTTPIAQRRLFPNFNSINEVADIDNSIYNGLEISGERRFRRGLSFQLAYTYSHGIDYGSGNLHGYMNTFNRRLDRGNADSDVRHRFAASWTYELPFKSSRALVGPAIQGWQINAILSLFGGLPFSVNSATNTLNIGSGTRADRAGSGRLPSNQRTLQEWFDLNAFAPPGPQKFGNSGRNILTGPNTKQLDFSTFKDFALGRDRSRHLQFRAEFFNLFNRPQFNNPNSTVGIPGAGSITSAGSPLSLQRTSRQIQFALKLYF